MHLGRVPTGSDGIGGGGTPWVLDVNWSLLRLVVGWLRVGLRVGWAIRGVRRSLGSLDLMRELRSRGVSRAASSVGAAVGGAGSISTISTVVGFSGRSSDHEESKSEGFHLEKILYFKISLQVDLNTLA